MEKKNKVGRPSGTPKTGGRAKGTPNAVTTSLRSKIDNLINDNWDNIQQDLDALEAKDRLTFLEKLLAFAVPKLASTTSEVEITNKLNQLSDAQLDQMIQNVLDDE
jgi:hypothetical protein